MGAVGMSLVIQWLRICLPMQGTPAQPPVGDLRFHKPRTTKSTHHSYGALAPQPKILQDATETQSSQIEKPYIYIHIYAHTYTHTCIYTYIHTQIHIYIHVHIYSFPGGANGKEPTCRCRRHKSHGFNPWVRKSTATHSSFLACRIPLTEELGGLQSIELQRVGHNWSALVYMHICVYIYIWVAIFFNGGYESHGLDCLSPSQLHLPSLYLTLPRFGQVIFHISLYLFASLCCHIDVPFAWTALPHFLLAVKSPFTVLESSCSLQLWAPQRLPVEVPPHETMLRHLCAPSCQCPGEFSERDYAPMPQYSKHRGTNWTRSGSSHFFVMNPLK